MTGETAALDIPVRGNRGVAYPQEPDYDTGWITEDGVLNDGRFERSKITRNLPPDETHPHERQISETVEMHREDCAPTCPGCGDTTTADDEPTGQRCENPHDED